MKRCFLLFALLLGMNVAVAESFDLKPDAGPQVDSLLASCNGEPILLSDVLKESRADEYRIYAANSSEDAQKAVAELRRGIVERMIERKLLLAEFREKKYQVPEQLVENMLDEFAVANGCRTRSELESKVRSEGMDFDKLRQEARERLIYMMMLNSITNRKAYCSPKQLYEYYLAHRERYSEPEKLELSLILVSSGRDGRDAVLKTLAERLAAAPAEFGILAQRFSDGPGAAKGGDLGWIPRLQLRKEFASALSEIEIGRVVGPLELTEGTFYLMVTDLLAPRQRTFKEVSPQIREELENATREELRKAHLDKLRAAARIKYFF